MPPKTSKRSTFGKVFSRNIPNAASSINENPESKKTSSTSDKARRKRRSPTSLTLNQDIRPESIPLLVSPAAPNVAHNTIQTPSISLASIYAFESCKLLVYLLIISAGIYLAELLGSKFESSFRRNVNQTEQSPNCNSLRNQGPLSFLESLYFTVVTLSTVGYGDYTCATIVGKTLTTFLLLFNILRYNVKAEELAQQSENADGRPMIERVSQPAKVEPSPAINPNLLRQQKSTIEAYKSRTRDTGIILEYLRRQQETIAALAATNQSVRSA